MELELNQLLKTAGLAAPCAWFVTEIGKETVRHVWKGATEKRFWYTNLVRLLSVASGGGAGWLLESTPEGALAGLAGGVFASTIVFTLKKYIKGLAAAKSEGGEE